MMKNVFEQALGINKPWFISKMNFVKKKRLDVYISFEAGTQFEYISEEENTEGKFPVYDTKEKTWRHLNLVRPCSKIFEQGLVTGDLDFTKVNEHYEALTQNSYPLKMRRNCQF